MAWLTRNLLANMSTPGLTQALSMPLRPFSQQWVGWIVPVWWSLWAVVQVLTKTLAITTPQLHPESFCELAVVTGSPSCERSILWPQGNMSPCDRHGLNSGTKQARFGTGCNSYPAPEAGYQIAQCVYLTSQSLQKSCLGWSGLALPPPCWPWNQWYFTHCRAGGPEGQLRGTRVIGEAGRHTAAVFIYRPWGSQARRMATDCQLIKGSGSTI